MGVIKPVVLLFLPSLIFAGMPDEEDLAAQRKSEQEAARTDAQWKAGGEAAISDMIRALCADDIFIREKAEERLVTIGVPVIRLLFNKSFRRAADTNCYGFGGQSPLDQVLADLYCNSARFENHGAEWDTAITLLRKKFIDDPEEALGIISQIAVQSPRLGCFQFEHLLNQCLPMISTILRRPGGPSRKNALDTRYWALKTVAAIGPQAAPLVRDILPLLRSPDLDAAAAEALEKIGPAASAAAKELRTAMLRDTSKGRAIVFVKALGAMGPKAREALPDIKRLTERLVDQACACDNQRQLETAVEAMCRLASYRQDFATRCFRWISGTSNEAIVTLLRRELRSAHECKRMPVSSICMSLSWLGKSSASAFGELMAFVRDRHENIATRAAAATVLYQMGSAANLSPSDQKLVREALPQGEAAQLPPMDKTSDSSTVPSR